MKVLVLGGSGMLGEAVARQAELAHHEVLAPRHQDCAINDRADVTVALDSWKPDVVVNAAGVIHATFGLQRTPSRVDMVMTNSVGPQILGELCPLFGAYLIHVSTDCVFSGAARRVNTVVDHPDATDIYGRSKMVGEDIRDLSEHPIAVVRTSFIGPRHGLLPWLLNADRRGVSVQGYTEAWWSGSTVDVVAAGIVRMLDTRPRGLHHLAGPVVSKAAVLKMIRQSFGLGVHIVDTQKPFIGRALEPTIPLPGDLEAAIDAVAKEMQK